MESLELRGREIRVRVTGLPTKKIKDFVNFQGALKFIPRDQLEKLKMSIVRNGFNSPLFIWKDHNYILDGHQRLAAVRSLIEKDGMILRGEELPYVEIEADNEKQAKEMVLTYNSQYGEIDVDVLSGLLKDLDLPATELNSFTELPDVRLEELLWKTKEGWEYEIVRRDLVGQEAQLLKKESQKGNMWAATKMPVRIGGVFFFVGVPLGQKLQDILKKNGSRWFVQTLFPEVDNRELITCGKVEEFTSWQEIKKSGKHRDEIEAEDMARAFENFVPEAELDETKKEIEPEEEPEAETEDEISKDDETITDEFLQGKRDLNLSPD